jgi:hypothetical protein
MGRTIDDDVLEEVMTVRSVLLLVLVCGAGLTGSITRPANAAAFTCPDTLTSDAPRNTSPPSGPSSGETTSLPAIALANSLLTSARQG